MSAADVSPGSHIHTPEWQSFELRMRARAAQRREAKRRRRLRYLGLTLVGCLGIAAGWLTVSSLPYLTREFRIQVPRLATSAETWFAETGRAVDAQLARMVASEPPSPPARPAPIRPVAADPLPVPASLLAGEPAGAAPATSEEPAVRIPAPATTAGTDAPAGTAARREATVSPRRDVVAASAPAQIRTPRERVMPPAPERTASSSPASAAWRPSAGSIAPVTPPPAAIEPITESLPERPPAEAAASTSAPPAFDPTRSRAAVRGTIERYRSAYERLDASAASSVWPGVDADALARAFGSLESQRLSFDDCTIDVAAGTADATCTGRASVVPKIGGGSQTVRRTWRFRLAQQGDSWTIASATVR